MHPQTAKYSAWIGVVLFLIGFLLAIIGLAAKSAATILASYFLFGIGGLLLFLALIFSIIGVYESTHAISESDNKENSVLLQAAEKGLNHNELAQIEEMFLKQDFQCYKCDTILLKADIYKDKDEIICTCRNCKAPNILI